MDPGSAVCGIGSPACICFITLNIFLRFTRTHTAYTVGKCQPRSLYRNTVESDVTHTHTHTYTHAHAYTRTHARTHAPLINIDAALPINKKHLLTTEIQINVVTFHNHTFSPYFLLKSAYIYILPLLLFSFLFGYT